MNNTLNSLPRKLFEVAGSLVPPKAEAASFSPIFVAGFARSGKTLITKNLKNEYGMSTFGLDLIRDPAYSDTAVRRLGFKSSRQHRGLRLRSGFGSLKFFVVGC